MSEWFWGRGGAGETGLGSVSFSCLQAAVLKSSSVYWISPAMEW